MNVAVPLTCKICGEPLSPLDEKCPYGHLNPDYDVRALLRSIEKPKPAAPARPEPALRAAPAADVWFQPILEELASARASGCKVIANVGLSEAGKSWLIARMSMLRPGVHEATLYSERQQPAHRVFQTGDELPRTSPDEVYVWHLQPPDEGEPRAVRSGRWRIIDIAGELVSDPGFINRIVSGRPLYDLLTMTLAHASALVYVVDGEELAREDGGERAGAGPTVDERNKNILNELVLLMRFLQHHAPAQGLTSLEELEALKHKIRENRSLTLDNASTMLNVPALLMIAKVDALVELPPRPPGFCPLEYAERRLPSLHRKALENISVSRWAAAAPFVGQSRESAPEILNFQRASYGVGEALEWLDTELTPGRREAVTALRALSRLARWSPFKRRHRAP